tara:strand:+ start:19572 stop:20516 length:945 start_codon:yes stop_codon:yes gene_type:complete
MTFFNKKEDVLKIELTPHGRKMLSKGKLKPVYYTFLDDDILYDSAQGGVSENNSQTKSRILSETPYMKPQTNYKGVESSLRNEDNKVEQVTFLQQTIGSNNTSETRASGWNITALLGEIESSSKSLTGSTTTAQQIPQLELEINYTMSVGNQSDLDFSNTGLLFNTELPSVIKADGSFVKIEKEQVLLNIFERNGFFHKDSYELEVYLFEQDEIQIDRKLTFHTQETQVINNMLVVDDIDTPQVTTTPVSQHNVEYYLNLNTDKKVPEEDICTGLRRLKAKDIFLDLEVRCPDRDGLDINIYGSRVSQDDLEEC